MVEYLCQFLRPVCCVLNSADRMFHAWKHFWITVRYTGFARWQPGGNFAFTCALDMNYYPFDQQQCTMEVETWYYTSEKVRFVSYQKHTDTHKKKRWLEI